MFLLDSQQKFVIVYAIIIALFAVLFIVAIFFLIRKLIRMHKLGKDTVNEVDENLKDDFISAYGGIDNIIDVKKEMSRITVTVKDIDIVNGEKLKELGASGILFVSNMVKCSFNELSESIYKLLERK